MNSSSRYVQELSFLDTPRDLIVRLWIRWSLFTFAVLAITATNFLALTGSIPRTEDGMSRVWDCFAGPLWCAMIFGSFWLYQYFRGTKVPAVELHGKGYYSIELVFLIGAWLATGWGVVITMIHGISIGFKEGFAPICIINAAQLCLFFNIPGLICRGIKFLNESEAPVCRFLSGRSG